ncbi:MAG: penicillin-insensitive murein endopeptidase [Pseudomonadota bacterium]
MSVQIAGRRPACSRTVSWWQRAAALTLGVASLLPSTHAARPASNPWADVAGPSPGRAIVYGKYTAGCVAGAESLAPVEDGLRVMRLSRKRNFGHPNLIRFVRELATAQQAGGFGSLLVGDLGQARGGPTYTNHISHQSGLDVDIWFRVLPEGTAFPSDAPERWGATQYVHWRDRKLLSGWGAPQAHMVRFAAEHAAVQRIFVSPVIKRELCRTAGRARAWLGKVRPWFGHGDHMHVRLKCPPDSPGCIPQRAVPRGDGCGVELASWLAPPRPGKSVKRKPRPPLVLPGACGALLER